MCIYQPKPITQKILERYQPTRLAIKELAGQLYFCKSIVEDIESYPGSGVVWNNRIKKYGKQNIKTLWVSDWYYDPYEIKQVALHFSKENQVVESDGWANQKPEDGLDGGRQPPEIQQRITKKIRGQKRTAEQNAAKSKRQTGTKKSQQWLDKRIGSKYQKHKSKNDWEFVGEKHWNYQSDLYEFENIQTRERVIATKNEFSKRVPGANPKRIITGERKTSKGWRFIQKINPAEF